MLTLSRLLIDHQTFAKSFLVLSNVWQAGCSNIQTCLLHSIFYSIQGIFYSIQEIFIQFNNFLFNSTTFYSIQELFYSIQELSLQFKTFSFPGPCALFLFCFPPISSMLIVVHHSFLHSTIAAAFAPLGFVGK